MAHPGGEKIRDLGFLKKSNRNFNNVLESVKLLKGDVLAKTSDYTVTTTEFARNSTITVSGSVTALGGINITLPSASSDLKGCKVEILGLSSAAMTASFTPTGAALSNAIVSGSTTASSIAINNGKGLGGKITIFCDGTRMIGDAYAGFTGTDVGGDVSYTVT